MATPAPIPPVDEHDLYPIHEEDDVPEIPLHERQTRYVRDALSARFPDRHVTGNVCIYWVPRDYGLYVAPDLFVAAGPPAPLRRVHLTWQDPPLLFVAEIGSRSTLRIDEEPKLDRYSRDLQVPEYLYFDPAAGTLRLWRLRGRTYEAVEPGENGRLRSEQLGLEFGIDETGFLEIYTPDGVRLLTYEEAERQREEAERRAAAQAQLREEAERRAAAQAQLREEAERRAAAEAGQRRALEQRLAELQAELERRASPEARDPDER